MKKLICVSLALLLLVGCAAPAAETTGQSPYVPLGGTKPAATTDGTPEATTEPTATSALATTTAPPDQGYLQSIVSHDQPIFDQPTYDGTVVATVKEAGTYTVVEEVTDSEGNLWGKLKSGAGWVDLTAVRKDCQEKPLITVAEASMALVPQEHHMYSGTDTEHNTAVIFHAYGPIRNVALYSGWWDGEWKDAKLLYSLDAMDGDVPLVANLAFTGDMTMFQISFTDADGNTRTFYVSQNGRNNALTLSEH